MCVPLLAAAAIVSVVASAASAGLSVYGQQQQRKVQVEYQNRFMDANAQQMQENRDLATRAYLDQASAAHTQLSETREATAAANFDKSRQGAEARGATLASAAEAGVYGVSLDGLLADFHRQEDMFRTRNEQNLVFKQQATASQVRGYHSEATSRTNQIKPYLPGPIAPVDYVGPALQVVKDGSAFFMRFKAGAAKGSGTNGGGPFYDE